MNIRTAHISDIDSLVEFNQAMALETEGRRLDAQQLKAGVEAVFTDENKGFYLVAEEDEKILGALMVTAEWSDWRNAWFWWIQSVYVIPEARGKKIYRKLYEEARRTGREAGRVCGFRLYVEKDNATAQAVYKKLGMEESEYLMFEGPK